MSPCFEWINGTWMCWPVEAQRAEPQQAFLAVQKGDGKVILYGVDIPHSKLLPSNWEFS